MLKYELTSMLTAFSAMDGSLRVDNEVALMNVMTKEIQESQ